MLNIIDLLLTQNRYSRVGLKMSGIKGIVVHYVGNPNTTAQANRNYFENLKSGKDAVYASSHYIIGLNGEIVRCIPEDEIAYHAGNSEINSTYIGIENCHPDSTGKFNSLTYNSLVELCVDICKRYGINEKNIIRHYDVTGKACPLYYVNNPGKWDEFIKDVKNAISAASSSDADKLTSEQLANNEKTIKKLATKITIDEAYWLSVLSGNKTADKLYLAAIFERLAATF